MTREEITDGLFLWMGAYGIKEDDMVKAGMELFRFLHSQGVVIKVGELPSYGEQWSDEKDYVAVEPLIDICDHDWIKLRNEVITAGEICTKCKSLAIQNKEKKE